MSNSSVAYDAKGRHQTGEIISNEDQRTAPPCLAAQTRLLQTEESYVGWYKR
jgi:hypothetical protein